MKSANLQFQDESEDDILARIQEESLRYYNEVELPRRAAAEAEKRKKCSAQTEPNEPQAHCSRIIEAAPLSPQPTQVKDVFYKGQDQGAEGFHLAAGQTYVYPTNYPIRKYQKSIIHSALFHNTLVSLPTGLGKTFIAAVVMYNYYRWFPQGKIVFMAPTRPLVAQQIRACHDIMAIPINETIEMTGTMNPVDRVQHWKSKRVFFLTPQVMANDLRNGACPAKLFKCVVIDEAHKATKEYAFCVVIKELEKAGAIFRVLALSATPGSSVKAVGDVVQNLRIAVLELRGEDSEDVAPYTHAKQVEPVSLPLPDHVTRFREQFLLIFEKYASNLRSARLITANVQNFSKFQLLKSCEKLRTQPPAGMSKQKLGVMISDFTVCMTLAHGLELLQTYGLRAFYQYFTGGCEDEENRKSAFTRLNQDMEFHELMSNLNKLITQPMNHTWSHPKHEYLVNILMEHFSQFDKEGTVTKVIIFCQFRVVVSEVYELLLKIHPLIKPVMFIGQGLGKDKNGLPQKKQIEVMKQFREGVSNVLIATCVAEEGLDIGSVDLLVLMDTQRSPVRLVQRLGRTGRHRAGRCVVLLTAGKEVQKFNEAMATRKNFISNIQKSKYLAEILYKDEPSMIPPHLMPKIQLVHINVPQRVTPGKVKKQADIRASLVAKLNDSEELAVAVAESPFLSKKELDTVREELGTTVINFDSMKFTDKEYLHHRINENQMSSEELFSNKFVCHSAFVDWNRTTHDTYVVHHSADSLALCDLLNRAEAMQLGLDPQQDVNSQMNMSDLFPKNKKGGRGKAKDKVTENLKQKKNFGMDIRTCMAIAADKARLTQERLLNKDPVVILDLTDPSEEPLSSQWGKDGKHPDKCLLCDHKEETRYKRIPMIDDSPFPFSLNQLLAVETLVNNLTLDDINNIDVAKLFISDEGFTGEEMQKSISNMKQENFNNLFQEPAVSVGCDSNCNNVQTNKTSHYVYSSPNITTKSYKKKEGELKNIISKIPNSLAEDMKNEFLNVDDIFSDDDDFNLDLNVKTSTPVKQLIPTPNPETSCIVMNSINKTPTKENNTSKTKRVNPFRVIENSTSSNSITKPIFKIPQLKLNLHTPKSSNSLVKLGKNPQISSPGSPILSGQITASSPPKPERKALFTDAHNSFRASTKISSQGSPILSGQITALSTPPKPKRKALFTDTRNSFRASTNNSSPGSPILSGQITALSTPPKPERKALFTDARNSFRANTNISSPGSPILSGQITTARSSVIKNIDLLIDKRSSLGPNPKISSPESPILSGQVFITSPSSKFKCKALFTDNSSRFHNNASTSNAVSPILSGRMTSSTLPKPDRKALFSDAYLHSGKNAISSPESSPILYSQIINTDSTKRPDRTVLFPENDHKDNTDSLMCKPLNTCSNMPNNEPSQSEITCSQLFDSEPSPENVKEISVSQLFEDSPSEENEQISVSQLFEDDERENKNNESSMYTISQMLAKVDEIQEKNKKTIDVDMKKESTVDQYKNNSVQFGDGDEEDSLLANIDLDKLTGVKENKPLTNAKEHVNKPTETVYKVNKSVYFSNNVLEPNKIPSAQDKLSCDSLSPLDSIFCKTAQHKRVIAGHQRKQDSKWLRCSNFTNKNEENKLADTLMHSKDLEAESESNSDTSLFISPVEPKTKSESEKKENRLAKKRRKVKGFVEFEADVSGAPRSSDEENTSGLDDLDASFINDQTELPLTPSRSNDIHSHYLQSVKSPFHKAGGFKIPTMSESVLAMDVYSQAVQPDHDSYLNDSFCCDATEIPEDNDPSILEVAERILRKQRKKRKRKKKMFDASSYSSSEDEQICSKQVKKRRRLSSGSSSDSDSKFIHNIKSVKRRNQITDSSPETALPTESNKLLSSRKNKKLYLLNSEESDSDLTP